jgi:hypothetical protein
VNGGDAAVKDHDPPPHAPRLRHLHLEPGYLRREINLLSLAPSPADRAAARGRFSLYLQALTLERDTGLEPATFSLGKRKSPFRAVTGSDK